MQVGENVHSSRLGVTWGGGGGGGKKRYSWGDEFKSISQKKHTYSQGRDLT